MRELKSWLLTLLLLFVVGVSINHLVDNHKMRHMPPETVFVRPMPGSLPVTRFELANGQTLWLPFDETVVVHARSQVFVGDPDKYWLEVVKNGQHLDDIVNDRRFTIATGDYELIVHGRDDDSVVSRVRVKAYHMGSEPNLTRTPQLSLGWGFLFLYLLTKN